MLEELDALITNISPNITMTKVQVSPNPDKLAELLTRKDRLVNKLIIKQAEAVEVMVQVIRAIDSVEEPKLNAILVKHYIAGYSLEEIANAFPHEYSWLTRLHIKAIDSIKL